jgi:hypothetical protein
MASTKLFDTKEAGARLGISERRVRALCDDGRLGTQIAGRWVITEAELRVFKPHPTGRPKGLRKKRG